MARASEQERPDVVLQREAWFEGQLDLDPDRLVFVDESWASSSMARGHGRCPRGERLRMSVPHGHWKTTTFIAGLRSSWIFAPYVNDYPVSRDIFKAWVEQALLPELQLGDTVIMDSLSSHQRARAAN